MEQIIKSNQEQTTSAIIEYLKQIKLAELVKALYKENSNLEDALQSIDVALEDCHILIESNRGGAAVHGFIAEAAQKGVGNAWEQIKGNSAIYEWVNNNGELDLLRNGIEGLQLKFYNGPKATLLALKEFLEKYPSFLEDGGKYQIPKDYYEKIVKLYQATAEEAKQFTNNSEFTHREWEFVKNYFENSGIKLEDIEPSELTYAQVQKNTINATLSETKTELKEENFERKKELIKDNKSTPSDIAKAGLIGASLEGGTTLFLEIKKKLKEKRIKEFNSSDWEEILKNVGISTVKGGVRGVVIQLISNKSNLPDNVAALIDPKYYAKSTTPASVANAIVTASFGMAEQVHLFRQNEISETDFIINSEIVCLEASVSALSSLVGQAVIPIPVLGAIIGNTVGNLMYKTAKDSFNEREQELTLKYANEQKELDEELAKKFQNTISLLNENMNRYFIIMENSFNPDIEASFIGSIELAKYMGVPTEEILDTKAKIDNYFLN